MSTALPVIKRLDHLGLIAAFYHEIGLPDIIDRVIPKDSVHNVSHGNAVLAMILNGLGFHRALLSKSARSSTTPCMTSRYPQTGMPSPMTLFIALTFAMISPT